MGSMADIKKVEAAINKAVQYLVNVQDADGAWSGAGGKHNEPEQLRQSINTAAQLTLALIENASQRNVDAIIKGLNCCLNYPLSANENVNLASFMLLALRRSNTKRAQRTCEKLAKFIISRQCRQGYWKSFPSTYNFTNYFAAYALSRYDPEKDLSRLAKWFAKTKAKDGLGWGIDNNAAKSEPSFTANVILASLFAGADPTADYLQKAKQFLESKQFENGGWCSSSYTVANKPTTYSTALCVQSLMLLSDNLFNKNIENGIKFLLKAQNPQGYWGLLAGEKEFVPYTNFYILEALTFYLFAKKLWRNKELAKLKENLAKPQYLTLHLNKLFDDYTKTRLFEVLYANLLRSKLLGTTAQAIERRNDILVALTSEGEKDVAEVIDELKKLSRYSYLNKRAHYTQIKADLDFLLGLNLIGKHGEKYFAVFDLS